MRFAFVFQSRKRWLVVLSDGPSASTKPRVACFWENRSKAAAWAHSVSENVNEAPPPFDWEAWAEVI